MAIKVQALLAEIARVEKTSKTMMKRLRKQGVVISKTKKYLREVGIRPYNKKQKEMEIRN